MKTERSKGKQGNTNQTGNGAKRKNQEFKTNVNREPSLINISAKVHDPFRAKVMELKKIDGWN